MIAPAGRTSPAGPSIMLSPTIAWGLVVLILFLVWFALVEPVLTLRGEVASDIAATRSVVARQRALVARAAAIEQRLARTETLLQSAGDGLVDGTGAAGDAVLRSALRRLGDGTGVSIDRIGTVDGGKQAGPAPYPAVRLSAAGTGTIDQIQRFLHALESGTPRIRVIRMAIAPRAGEGEVLSVEIEVAALARGGGE